MLNNAVPSLNVAQLNLQDGLINLANVDWKNLPSEVVEDLKELRKIGSANERDLPPDKFMKLLMYVQVVKFLSLISFILMHIHELDPIFWLVTVKQPK